MHFFLQHNIFQKNGEKASNDTLIKKWYLILFKKNHIGFSIFFRIFFKK